MSEEKEERNNESLYISFKTGTIITRIKMNNNGWSCYKNGDLGPYISSWVTEVEKR